MKKIIAIAFLITLIAAPAFAALGEYSSTSNPGGTNPICVLSKNVTLNVVDSATRFAAASAHTSGSKQFGTTSTSTSIFSTTFNGADLEAPTVSDTTSFTSWTTL